MTTENKIIKRGGFDPNRIEYLPHTNPKASHQYLQTRDEKAQGRWESAKGRSNGS